MICKKAMKIAMGVGMVLCATASFAAKTEHFESTLDGNTWSGDISDDARVSATVTAPAVGYPITNAAHTLVLNVEGSATCTNGVQSGSSISDFLIYIPEPSDSLEVEDGELDGAKIAIAAGTETEMVGTQVPLYLYCTTNGSDVGWANIGMVNTCTWSRVTLAFTNGFCRVSLDGEPVKSGYGYTSFTDGTRGGAWYALAGSGNNVESLKFIGCAKLDDVVIKDAFEEIIFPANVSPTMANMPDETVNYNDLNKWGVTSAYLNENYDKVYPNGNTSGMTIAQKLECGLDPTTDTKFEPVSITKTSATEATITFPCDDSTKTGRYKIVITGGTCNNATEVTGATTEDCEDGRAKITLTGLNQTAPVMTFKLVAERPNN